MKKRLSLVAKGLFPETLPPCFTSKDAERAFTGLVRTLDAKRFTQRSAQYGRYNGTKHDRTRRYFGSPNIVTYFHVSSFLHRHWADFDERFKSSPYSLSAPAVMDSDADRAIKVASLSELSAKASERLRYSPVVLKTDITQFFSSIYTHSVSWSRHGIAESKRETGKDSKSIYFNELDFHIRNCQSAQTRGVLIGPDGFRLVAEYIACGIDAELKAVAQKEIIGAVRHVDDFYIGIRSETDALVVLSRLREILARYELHLNDSKTKIISGLEPINDLWAQQIRAHSAKLNRYAISQESLELLLDTAFSESRRLGSDSPVKMALRSLDNIRVYETVHWKFVEGYLQRCMHYHPHAIDYVCLLVAKRNGLDEDIDYEGWKAAAEQLLKQHAPYQNHHEIIWLLWMMLACEIDIQEDVIADLVKIGNTHISALLVQAFADGRITKKPAIKFSSRLPSADAEWLTNIVARSCEFTKANFGGQFSGEFEHLASRRIRLIDIDASVKGFAKPRARAISRTRYGYDDDGRDDDDDIGF